MPYPLIVPDRRNAAIDEPAPPGVVFVRIHPASLVGSHQEVGEVEWEGRWDLPWWDTTMGMASYVRVCGSVWARRAATPRRCPKYKITHPPVSEGRGMCLFKFLEKIYS